jgi:hypothetical protein
MRSVTAAVGILLLTTPLFPQTTPHPADGKREVGKGVGDQPMTWVHDANSDRILRAEDADSVTEFLYDAGDVQTGITVRPAGRNLAFTIMQERDGLRTEGLPEVHRVSNDEARDSAVRTGSGQEIASYRYSSGYVSEVTVGDRLRPELSRPKDNRVTETLRDAGGRKIRESVAAGRDGHIGLGIGLDVVEAELGLGADWRGTVTFHTSASGDLMTVTNASGDVILYVVSLGTDRVAFDTAGKPLLYDLAITVASSTVPPGSDVGPEDPPSIDLAAVVPDHIVLSHTGMTGAYVSHASAGAINSFWTERDGSGQVVVKSRTTELDRSTR